MLTSGDVVDLELGTPAGHEAGFRHPAIVVTAQRVLKGSPSVLQVVPLTSTLRRSSAEVTIDPDRDNGLDNRSAAQCQHVRSVSPARVLDVRGNVGAVTLTQIRETLALLLDLPV